MGSHATHATFWPYNYDDCWDVKNSILNAGKINAAWQNDRKRAGDAFTGPVEKGRATDPDKWKYRLNETPPSVDRVREMDSIVWTDPIRCPKPCDISEKFDSEEYEWLTTNTPQSVEFLRLFDNARDSEGNWPMLEGHSPSLLVGLLNFQASLAARHPPTAKDCLATLWPFLRTNPSYVIRIRAYNAENTQIRRTNMHKAGTYRYVVHVGVFERTKYTVCSGLIIDQATGRSYFYDPCWADKQAEARLDMLLQQAQADYCGAGAMEYIRRRITTIKGHQATLGNRWGAPLFFLGWLKSVFFEGTLDRFRDTFEDSRTKWITGISREFANVPVGERDAEVTLRRRRPLASRRVYEDQKRSRRRIVGKDITGRSRRQRTQATPPPPPVPAPVPQVQSVDSTVNFWNKGRRDAVIIPMLRANGTWKARDMRPEGAEPTSLGDSPFLSRQPRDAPVAPITVGGGEPDLHLPRSTPLPWEDGNAPPVEWLQERPQGDAHLIARFGAGFSGGAADDTSYWEGMPKDEALTMLVDLYNGQGTLARKDWLSAQECRAMAQLVTRDSSRVVMTTFTGDMWSPQMPVSEYGPDPGVFDIDRLREADVFVLWVNTSGSHWASLVIDQITGYTYWSDSLFHDRANEDFLAGINNLVKFYRSCAAPDDLLEILRSNSWVVDAPQQEDSWSCGLQSVEFIRVYIREGLLHPGQSTTYRADTAYAEKNGVPYVEAVRQRWIAWITGEFCSLSEPYEAGPLRNITRSQADYLDKLKRTLATDSPGNSQGTPGPPPTSGRGSGLRGLDVGDVPGREDGFGDKRIARERPAYPQATDRHLVHAVSRDKYINEQVDRWQWIKNNTAPGCAVYLFSRPADWPGWPKFHAGEEWDEYPSRCGRRINR